MLRLTAKSEKKMQSWAAKRAAGEELFRLKVAECLQDPALAAAARKAEERSRAIIRSLAASHPAAPSGMAAAAGSPLLPGSAAEQQ